MPGNLPGHRHPQQALRVTGAPCSEGMFTPTGAGTSFFSDLGNAMAAVRPAQPPPTATFIQRPTLPTPPSAFPGNGPFHRAPAMQQPTPFQGPVGAPRPPSPPKYPGTPPGEAPARLLGGYASPSPVPSAHAPPGQIPFTAQVPVPRQPPGPPPGPPPGMVLLLGRLQARPPLAPGFFRDRPHRWCLCSLGQLGLLGLLHQRQQQEGQRPWIRQVPTVAMDPWLTSVRPCLQCRFRRCWSP